MKNLPAMLAATVLLSLGCLATSARAQGSLTPPGAPAPTMKTLDQLEPRTAVTAVNTPGGSGYAFIISQPGSYYLTTNLVSSTLGAIEILTNNVALDLNGFTIFGGGGQVNGVYLPNAQTNILVQNGTLYGLKNSGVLSASIASWNQVFERLNISSCGNGIYLSGVGVVRNCQLENNSARGVFCYSGGVVSACTVVNSGDLGVFVGLNGTVTDCVVQNSASYGIWLQPGKVSGCWVRNSKLSGIFANAPGCTVIDNTCIGNNTSADSSEAGIFINDANNRVEDNHVAGSGVAGIKVSGSYGNNLIIKNSVTGNGANNYVVPGTQLVGPLIPVTGSLTNASPWANFSF